MQVKNRVCAVALTDSAHHIWHQETTKGTQDWMQQYCCNWVSSPEPLDTELEPMLPDCPRVSAVVSGILGSCVSTLLFIFTGTKPVAEKMRAS
ncbi:hypothetical protein AMECASPLE_003478 [Ameca splendens]|uniref:Arb2 domain-containing protein n=1 Tax=Ameca splendens TaxID=208324 RepID=A0ABV0XBL7_9TELE